MGVLRSQQRCNSVCCSDIKKLESLMTGGVITTAALGADSKKLEQACFVAHFKVVRAAGRNFRSGLARVRCGASGYA